MTEIYVEELKIELQRLSPAALAGDEEALARVSEIEAEIGTVEQRERLEVLAARERERLEEEARQLEEEREANRENRRLLAAALERIPELPPASSQEASEAPETATAPSGSGERVGPRGGPPELVV